MNNFDILFNWAQTDFLTQQRVKLLKKFFGSLENAWEKGDLFNFVQAGIKPKSTQNFFAKKQKKDFENNLKKARETFDKIGGQLIFFEDDNYPQKLLQISSPPIFLFILGKILPEDDLSFSVVGTRNITNHGKQIITRFIAPLVKAGFTITSGLAKGIDSAAHLETLNSKGRTIAVLGSGIDNIWPQENISLAKKIIKENSAVISEFPIGTEPQRFNFPRRNRVVSGLSLGVLIVEGKEKSGSLITARMALEQNREVFAVPSSPFFPMSAGPNRLIKSGEAKLVENADDILEEFSIEQKKVESETRIMLPQGENERKILAILSEEVRMFDEIVRSSEMPAGNVSSVLTILEMKGFARNLGMGQWVIHC